MDAVKTGMLSCEETIRLVAEKVREYSIRRLVVDPEVLVLVVGEVPEQGLRLPGELRHDPGVQVAPESVQQERDPLRVARLLPELGHALCRLPHPGQVALQPGHLSLGVLRRIRGLALVPPGLLQGAPRVLEPAAKLGVLRGVEGAPDRLDGGDAVAAGHDTRSYQDGAVAITTAIG